ncbi:uncharacterized protein LOC109838843 [Asparagus officinalis]|uniref:uncharacterized protein LOC109838843 n=1 Tax=Asparagus officinalis TaxID=4686 RepID=UPI00098E78D2|nr:uncharacterized protein LOC109838843 [Asparagus officinalis]
MGPAIPSSHYTPPPLAYPPPPPNQAWGNPSWPQHQGWDYPDRNIPYSNEEDWAARAKAWAATQSGTENHHVQSQFMPVGRVDDRNYGYHDHYQQAVGPRDVSQPSIQQLTNHQFPAGMMDPLKQVNHLHGSTFNSGPSSYGTGYSVGDEATLRSGNHTTSPQRSYQSSSSACEQEVSYSYSSASGNREAIHHGEGSHTALPLSVSSIQEAHPSQSTLPVQMISTGQPHFSNHGPPTSFLPDACDRPLDFERKHDTDRESQHKINYGHTGPTGAIGIMNHDPTVSSVHTWPPFTGPGVGFPQIPLGPSGTQFDPTFLPQSSLAVQSSPVFGDVPPPSFQSSVPPLSAPFGLGPGAASFPGELNGALNLSERPKKAAVPDWLREEIIKKKSVIPSATSTQPIGNSFDSVGSGDGDKSIRRGDQNDSRSIDSTRSTEDEEDDEEDVEAARSAAINQEIKRVLTEVLLKVTDELFDEIATKVLNEDEQTSGVVEETVNNGNQRVSPVAIVTNKAAAKVLIPHKLESNEVECGDESSDTSPRGNVLGLANYASDDDDDETHSSKLLSSGKSEIQEESNDIPSDNDSKSVKDEADVEGVAEKHGVRQKEENRMMGNGSPLIDNIHFPDKASEGVSAGCEESTPIASTKVNKLHSENEISLKSNDVVTKDDTRQESTSERGKSDEALTKDNHDWESREAMTTNKSSRNRDNKVRSERTRRETSDTSDSIIQGDRSKVKEKMNRRDTLNERADDRSSERGSDVKEQGSRSSSKHNSIKDDRKEITQDKEDKYKEDCERKRNRGRDEKEDRHSRPAKDSSRYSSRRSPSPSSRGKNFKDNSFSHGSASGDEPSDNSKRRKKLSHASNLSPSPTKSRKRRVSRSPHSKHSHRRHSPYSSTERRRRSRSISPSHKRSSAHKRGS